MTAIFNVIRGGALNKIDLILGAADRAINVNANQISVPNATTYSIVKLDGTLLTLTGSGKSRLIDILAPCLPYSYSVYNRNGKIFNDIDFPATYVGTYGNFFDIDIDINAGAALSGLPCALNIQLVNNSVATTANNLIAMNITVDNEQTITGSLTGINILTAAHGTLGQSLVGAHIYCTSDKSIGNVYQGLFVSCIVSGATTVVNRFEGITIEHSVQSPATTLTDFSGLCFFLDITPGSFRTTADGIKMRCIEGIINGISIYYDIAHGAVWAGETWCGIKLDANGVTCAAGQTYYGLNIDASTMTVGGTINGIRCIVPNLTPAMVLGDGVGTLTVNFGAGNHPNIDSSTGRVYFGTQAGGSAAADAIYCKNVYQTAPWAENTWDAFDDLGILREINTAIFEQRTPNLPRQFFDKFNIEGYYNRLQMDALERGAILKLEDRIKYLEGEIRCLKTRNN